MNTKTAKPTPDNTSKKQVEEKKYTKVGNTPAGEWLVKNNATGEEKRASEFGDVTTENTVWT